MSNKNNFKATESRNEQFVDKIKTKIWLEEPSVENPYITETAYCQGYELNGLMAKLDYSEMIFLLFRGELPSSEQSELFRQLLIAFINPGPRNNGSRAAIQAAIGKTDPLHVLPIGLAIFSGENGGAKHVTTAMKFIVRNHKKSLDEAVSAILEFDDTSNLGYGSVFDGIDKLSQKVLRQLQSASSQNKCLLFANELSVALKQHNKGVLPVGVVAAALVDLGFLPRQGAAIFQLISAPGILAHGLEFVGKPRNQVPFLSDEFYEIIEEGEL